MIEINFLFLAEKIMGIFVNASSDGIDTFLILTTPAIKRTALAVKLASAEKHIFSSFNLVKISKGERSNVAVFLTWI